MEGVLFVTRRERERKRALAFGHLVLTAIIMMMCFYTCCQTWNNRKVLMQVNARIDNVEDQISKIAILNDRYIGDVKRNCDTNFQKTAEFFAGKNPDFVLEKMK